MPERPFTTELAVRLLEHTVTEGEPGSEVSWVRYSDAVRIAHDLYVERHPDERKKTER